MKAGQGATCEDITMDVLLRLLWNNFDGIWIAGKFNYGTSACVPAALCDSTGAYIVFAPDHLGALNFWPSLRRGRYTPEALNGDSAFILPTEDFASIDSLYTATEVSDMILARCSLLHDSLVDHPCVWYLDVFNEPSAWQLDRMLDTIYVYDNYFPSMFTQDTNMTEILPDGAYSWIKYKSDSLYSSEDDFPVVATTFSMLHTIGDSVWAGLNDGIHLGTALTQSNSVNAYFDMRYLQYDPTQESWDVNAGFSRYRFAGLNATLFPPLSSFPDLLM